MSRVPAQHPDSSLLCDYQEVLANPLKRTPCISFSLIQIFIELFVLHQFPDLGSYKYTCLDFCVTHIWEPIPQIFDFTPGFTHMFHKASMKPSFMCKGAENFSPEEQEEN